MRISELAERTGVPVHTLKFYLREGVLMPGEATSRTRADYGEAHVERVRLVRALVEHGGIGLDGVRGVVGALEEPPPTVLELLGAAHHAVPVPAGDTTPSREVLDLVDALGWQVEPGGPWLGALTATVEAARDGGVSLTGAHLEAYARAARSIAEVDVDVARDAATADQAVRTVIVGTVLTERMLGALRRLAQEAVSVERA